MSKKTALIFGVTGQDGSYLSEFLLSKGYFVHGVKRRSSSLNTNRLDHIYQEPFKKNKNFFLHYGDVTDAISVSALIKKSPQMKSIILLPSRMLLYHLKYQNILQMQTP